MKKNELLKPIASRAAVFLDSYLKSLPDPNKKQASLGDREITLQTVKEDPHVSSCIQSRKAGVFALEHELVFDETNQQYEEFFNSLYKKLNLRKIMKDVLDAALYGFAVLEINWQYVFINGQQFIVPSSVVGKPRDWFTFDSNNLLRLRNMEQTLVPKHKFLLIQNEATYTNPYGEALLSKCLWPVVFKKANFTYWIMFSEVYGMPKYVGTTAANRGSDDFEDFFDKLDDLIQDGKIVISDEEKIDGLNPASSTNTDVYDRFIERCNTEISKVLLSETLTTEIGGTGSYAAANTHYDVKRELTNADKRHVEQAMNDLNRWIMRFNFPGANPPEFIMYEQTDVDRPLAEVVGILTSGNSGFRPNKKFFIDRFAFKEDEFDIVDTTPAPLFEEPVASQPNIAPSENIDVDEIEIEHNHSHENEFVESTDWDQIIIDAFADRSVRDDGDIMTSQISTIKKFINSHNNFEDAISGIAKLFPDLNSDDLEKKLTNLLFIADVIGRLSVQKENEDATKK